MNRKAVKSFLICALAAVLLFSSGCGLISQVIASVFDGAPRDTKVTAPVLEKTDRDTSKNYYKEIQHETIPLSERPRNAFDQSAFDDCIGDFTALLKKTGNEKKLIDLYEEILDWIDVLETDYTLSDRDFYMDVSDEVLGDHLTELELQYMDNADAALRLFRDALKTDYADALRAYMGDELADSLAGYEDLTEEELELTRRQTELTQKYDALSIETPEDEEAWMRELKELYLELVDLNNEIARLHGYDNYAEYAYAEICMRDYTDADVEGFRMRYITYRLKDGEIRQNYYFFGKLKGERELVSSEGSLQWIPYDGFENLNMPLSAKHMILHYLKVGRFDENLYAGITEQNGTRFVRLEDFEG